MKIRAGAKASAVALALIYWLGLPVNGALAQAGLAEDPGTKAGKLFGTGDYKQCFEFVEPLALGTERKNPTIQFYYAALLKKYGRKDEAIAHFEELLKLAPYGRFESLAKENLRDLQGPATIQSNPRFGGRKGYAGLRVNANEISSVFSQSPAESAGLKVGDKIISIDGVDVRQSDSDAVGKRMVGLEGTRVNLVVERQGKQYSTSLVRSHPSDSETEAMLGKKSGGARERRPLEPVLSNKGAAPASDTKAAAPAKVGALLPGDPPITVFRHTADSDTVYREVVGELLQINPYLRSKLADYGLKIVLAPTLLEARPELVSERPSGYLHGGGYANCAGQYVGATKTMYVAERVSHGSSTPQLNQRLGRTFFHELGHALDHCNKISSSSGFLAAYQSDCNHLTNGLRDHFYYYTQSDAAGPTELFAELFACAVGPAADLDTEATNLTKTFPASFAFIKKNAVNAS